MSETISPNPTANTWDQAEGVMGGAAETPPARGARRVAGKVQSGIDKVTARLSEGVHHATDRSVSVVERTAGQARKVAETVEPFVRERPFMSSGLALGLGMLLGLLMASRGPKVIYIKTRPSG